MATSKTTEEQLADVKRFNEALRTHLKKANEELTATRNNQRTLIDLLADTMKRLRETEAALEEEKKKSSILPLHQHAARCTKGSHLYRADVWESGARACEALLTEARPSTEKPPVEGAGAAAAAAANTSAFNDEDLYA